jgi:hypothetical protein
VKFQQILLNLGRTAPVPEHRPDAPATCIAWLRCDGKSLLILLAPPGDAVYNIPDNLA